MPAYAVEVSPTEPNPTHHMSLVAEDGTEIGLILCDPSGKRLSTAVARANLQTSPVKTTTGDSQYSDGEPPFVTSAQQGWSGGQGQERFEDNRNKYNSGARIQTVDGKVVLGPREHFSTGYAPQAYSLPGEYVLPAQEGDIGRMKWTQADDINALTSRFITTDALTSPLLYLFGKAIGTATGPDDETDNAHVLHWEISNDDAGGSVPGTSVLTGTVKFGTIWTDTMMRWEEMDDVTPSVPNLAASTAYWLTLYPNSNADATDYVELGFWLDPDGSAGLYGGLSATSDDLGVTWSAFRSTTHQMIFRLVGNTQMDANGFLFFYRNQLYYLTRPRNGAPTLLMNGWRGVCDSNAGNTTQLLDATQVGTGWANGVAIGSVVWVFAGPGSNDRVPFRTVTGSADGILTVGSNWVTPHTIDTEYVVLGARVWYEISHNIAHPPTGRPAIGVGGDPPNDEQVILYIPQGHTNDAIQMFRQYNKAGVFTTESKDINDGTGGAGSYRSKLMINVQDRTKGQILVKVEDNNASGSTGIVAEARTPGTWTEQKGWGGDEWLGDSQPSLLINAIEYVDPNTEARVAWATTRDELFVREGGEDPPALWRSILLPELKSFASERTGHALAIWNTSLYLSLAGGLLEKLTGGNTLTDVGPGKGTGWPFFRGGEIESLASYPGQLFTATRPSEFVGTGFSTITRLTGQDSHDSIYETGVNRPLGDMIVQRVPNTLNFSGPTSRLWFVEGNDLMWINLPGQGSNPLEDDNYQFASEGWVESSRIYANLDDRQKVFSSIKLVSDELNGTVADPGGPDGEMWIEAGYQIDDDEPGWLMTAFYGGDFDTSPSQEVFITNYDNDQVVPVRGRYLRTRLNLNSIRDISTPVMRALLVESLIGEPHKFSFKATLLFEDNQKDLRDNPYTDVQAWQQAGRLQEYAEQLEIFTLHAPSSTLDGAKVVIAPPEVGPIVIADDTITTAEQEATENLIGTLSIIQVILPDLGLVP